MLPLARVLLVDDDESSFSVLYDHLESAGHAVRRASGVDDAAHRLRTGEVDVVVVSPVHMSSLDRLAAAQCASVPVSFIVAAHEPLAPLVRQALCAGVSDVIDTKWDSDALLVAVDRAGRRTQVERELVMLRARVGDEARRSLVGRSAAMTHLRERVGHVAASSAPVLVLGEAGTGKGVVARLIHDLSTRAARPMLTVRCAEADAAALEVELFGRVAVQGAPAHAGLLEEARGGTIVLEDALALPATLRAHLLHASTSRSACRVGASENHPIDVRVVLTVRGSAVAAQGALVTELLEQFNVSVIELPPLRDRRSDIPQLVQHFRHRIAAEQGLDLPPLAHAEMLPLLGGEWPGNVRELEQWVERSALAARAERPSPNGAAFEAIDLGSCEVTLDQLERTYILHVLAREAGHQSRTAERLGIDRRTLYRKLKRYRDEGAVAH